MGPTARVVGVPIDHFNPDDYRTYKNRYWMNDTYYEKGGPIFFYDNGEAGHSDAQVAHILGGSRPFAPLELARRYHGIAIVWEHRFYGESLPFELNETTGLALAGYDAYKYLNNEQALEDAVYFATHFQPTGYSDEEARRLSSPSTPWIWIGVSYAGIRAAMIRQRNPDVFLASWSSSGPVQTQLDNSVYYNPIQKSMPINCSADVHAAVTFADDTLTNGSPEEISVLKRAVYIAKAANPKGNITYPNINGPEDLSFWNVAQILAYVFQASFFHFQNFGYHVALGRFCDQLEAWNPSNFTNFTLESSPSILIHNSDDSPITYSGVGNTYDRKSAFYAFLYSTIQKSILDHKRFPHNPRTASDNASWTWQLCTQFAQFQVSDPSNPHNIISKFYNINNTLKYMCHAQFPYAPLRPNTDAVLKYGGWTMKPSNVMFTNGEVFPWRSLGIQAITETNNPNAPNRPSTTEVPPCNMAPSSNQVFGQVWPGQVHGSDMSRRLAGNNETTPMDLGIALFSQALDVWLKCFNPRVQRTQKGARIDGRVPWGAPQIALLDL